MPREANEPLLSRDLLQAVQGEVAKAQHGLDDTEYGFDRLFAQRVAGLSHQKTCFKIARSVEFPQPAFLPRPLMPMFVKFFCLVKHV